MGKDRVIKLIANLIGKSTAHKILVKYTNMPESVNHMLSEIDNYRGQLSEYIIQYNWNIYDKQKIMKEAEKRKQVPVLMERISYSERHK